MKDNKLQLALLITDASGNSNYQDRPDELWESASTIKIPIIYLTLQEMSRRRNNLNYILHRQPHHASRGAGIINWCELPRLSLRDLLYTAIVYSDCVATNMLLDYIGGQKVLNSWLESRGLITRLRMPYLIFTEGETKMPKVGITTAREMLALYSMLDSKNWPPPFRAVLDGSLANIHNSWLETSLPRALQQLSHKTGSMINCDARGDTVYNAAGSFWRRGRKSYFCLLSRGRLNDSSAAVSEEQLKRQITGRFYQIIKEI